MTYTVQLDGGPLAAAAGRTMLDLNTGPIRVAGRQSGTGIDWGDAAIQAYTADQVYGTTPVDYRVPNRVVKIPLVLGMDESGSEETVRSQLQEKVALLQTESGWLLRQRSGGPAMYADIVNATLTLPDVWGETGAIEPDVVLQLECLPDFYGDEVTLDTLTATGVFHQVLKAAGAQAAVSGDYPARCRIVVTDTSGNDQKGLLWGVRSRHYDSAATAALFYEAEAMTLVNGSTVAANVNDSAGDHVASTTLPAGSWVTMLATTLAAGGQPLTHTGSYRVWVRCFCSTAILKFRVQWGVGSLSVPITNDEAVLPGTQGEYLLDLGEIRLDAPPVGNMEWFGAFQVFDAAGGNVAAIDAVYLQPLDEGAGRLIYVNETPPSVISASEPAGSGANDAGNGGTVTWANPGNITALDATYATATFPSSSTATSEYLKAESFGFAIPTGATIKGIQVSVLRAAFGNEKAIVDTAARLVKAGTVQTTDRSLGVQWPTSAAYAIYGGTSDLWGGVWTPTDINDPGFGFAIAASSINDTALVDYISITVYYALASGFTVAQDAVVYANESAEVRTDGIVRTNGSVYGPVSTVIGDLPRLPPSRMEGRALEVFVKPTRGDFAALTDGGLDGLSVQVKYRPCWLSRP
jgi:hypothetical protein